MLEAYEQEVPLKKVVEAVVREGFDMAHFQN